MGDILKNIENRAYDYGSEYSEGVMDKVDDQAKGELKAFLFGWMEKNLTINFYQVFNVEPVVLTDEMIGDRMTT